MAEKGTSTHDLDLQIDTYDQPKIEALMKAKGFEPVGSSVVSPEEAKASGKNFGTDTTDWSRAHHFESTAEPRQKVDIWHREPAEVKEAVGLHEDDLPSRAKYQDVNWSAQDLQDSEKKVNEKTIRRDYANNRKDVSIYKAYIPMEDMPSARFPNENEIDEGENFDREDYRRPRVGVPVKVSVLPSGELQILDGNHRTRVWEEQGQQYAPAWVVDYRGPDIESLSDSEKEERKADLETNRGEVSP